MRTVCVAPPVTAPTLPPVFTCGGFTCGLTATAGAGALSGTQNEGLDYAAEKGVFVVTSTRTGSGRIASPRGGQTPQNLTPAQQRRREFSIAAEDHVPVKARILLMLALAKTQSRDEIQRIFSEY